MSPEPAGERAQVEELYARLCWALDTGDAEAYVGLFAPEAEVVEVAADGTARTTRGADALRARVAAARPGGQHRVHNVLVEDDPEGRSGHRAVRAYVLTTTADPARIAWTGRTDDVVVLGPGGARFRLRRIAPWRP